MLLDGWISIHRKIMKKGWYKKSDHFRLWIHLLLKANHKPNEFWFNGKNTIVKRGQFITGRKTLAIEIGISESKIERILNHFEKSEQQIEQLKTNRNRLITITNYNQYQTTEQQSEQPVNNKRTTSEQPVNTNNNVNNVNNVNNENKRAWFVDWLNYRKSIKKPITVEATFDSLVKRFNSEPIDKIKWVVTYSIEGGYQGLFWDKYLPNIGSKRTIVPKDDQYKDL